RCRCDRPSGQRARCCVEPREGGTTSWCQSPNARLVYLGVPKGPTCAVMALDSSPGQEANLLPFSRLESLGIDLQPHLRLAPGRGVLLGGRVRLDHRLAAD